MITFDQGKNRFNYRVVSVIIHEDAVLLYQAQGDNFWTFPGGRAEFGEPAEETIKREMREEISAEIEVLRLLWFAENFFTYAEKDYHEIALYFLTKLADDSPYLTQPSFEGYEESIKLIFQWFPCETSVLASLPLFPTFLQTELMKLPDTIQHIVHRD